MRKWIKASATALLALGLTTPALAAPANVGVAMAAFAAETAGEDAAARARALRDRHAQHQAQHKAGGDCGDCGDCCASTGCPDCAGRKEDCGNGLCEPAKHRNARGAPCGEKSHA